MLQSIWRELIHQLWRATSAVESALAGTYTGVILQGVWDLASQLWYFVVIGALISSLVWRYLPKVWVRDVLERRARSSIVVAALLGLVSPMCTFAAIPVVGTLVGLGVPAPPLVAFMVASPLMNPSLFVYTAGVISAEMAVARLLTALIVGLAAGAAAQFAVSRQLLSFDAVRLDGVPEGLYPKPPPGVGRSWGEQFVLLGRRFLGDLSFIARYFSLGILIAALVKAFLSEEVVMAAVGPGSPWAIPAAVALGVPLYACGGGSLPVIESMMSMGMTSGAALAFFIAGPATKFSTISMLAAVFGRRVLSLYLLVMLTGALFGGFFYPFEAEYLQTTSRSYDAMDQLFME
jgi:uncharacterized protein